MRQVAAVAAMLYANPSDTPNAPFINRLTATAMEREKKIEVDVAGHN